MENTQFQLPGMWHHVLIRYQHFKLICSIHLQDAILKMDAVCSFNTMVSTYPTTTYKAGLQASTMV